MASLQLIHGDRQFTLGRAVDLSIPLDFHGPQPNAYGVPAAKSRPYAGDGFLLDTREGGSCNCEVLEITPHCNGTHTESVGHLTEERFAIAGVMPEPFLACTVMSVTPQGRAITPACLNLESSEWLEALVIRTLPNDVAKKTRRWENDTTPYVTPEAMAVIRSRGVQHLLIDLPSIDPLYDDGKLTAHRVFWGLEPGSKKLPVGDALQRTVTEMIYVPDDVPDGHYLLTIQLPRFVSDAVPSRPMLFFLS